MPEATPESQARDSRLRHLIRRETGDSHQDAPLQTGLHSRGYLPHVKVAGAVYFVTFRTADSLPKTVMLRLLHERKAAECSAKDAVARDEAARQMQRTIERELDCCHGECLMGRDDCAEIVAGALKHFDGDRYQLKSWVVMPNHVHVLVWPKLPHTLSEILQSWKTFTARRINLLTGRTGERFWQPESFDRWLREEGEESRYREYIENNPVKAGLCVSPEHWKWSSAGQR
jgi:REP element-mobilizing transposase RayT